MDIGTDQHHQQTTLLLRQYVFFFFFFIESNGDTKLVVKDCNTNTFLLNITIRQFIHDRTKNV